MRVGVRFRGAVQMIEVRKKDLIFLALALPLALVAAYYWLHRAPAARRAAGLRAEMARLPDPDMFPAERTRLEARAAEAERDLDETRKAKPPTETVKGDPAADAAARQDALLAAFSRAGVRVVGVKSIDSSGVAQSSRGGNALRASGVRPRPEVRHFVLEGDYRSFVGALDSISREQAPVVCEGVSFSPASDGACRWELEIWL